MEKVIHYILKYLWVIREYTDKKGNKQHAFNLFAPWGYVFLLFTALIVGVIEFFIGAWRIVKDTVKDAYTAYRS